MTCHKLSNQTNLKEIISIVGSTESGANIMSRKGKMNLFYLKNLKTPAANILKQEALSIGAELAVPKGVITCEERYVDSILIATNAHLIVLVEKLLLQPFGLAKLAKILNRFLHVKPYKPKIMGILNTNEDSFFKGSRFVGDEAVKRVEKMIEDGADMIDVGGVSSRPGSEVVSEEEELSRIKPVIDGIYESKIYEKATFSLDSYTPLCLKYALDRGFKIVNDITALKNDEVAKISASYGATVCLMHMQNDPKTMQDNPKYDDVIEEVDNFFIERIQKAKEFGVKDIILDVGIGFGKDLKHNLSLIKHQEHFTYHGYELLVGASRKSMIDKIIKTPVEERVAGTLVLHIEAIKNGASIIRCHDVKEHKQALSVYEAIKDTI